ncbi:sugar ABC transporter ATP-binding protein [Fimbriimonas ginsengisoli]|nr:sugar ABC transporter ATP-binding protein [Fimbriimonas ginsengisoli]
MVRAVAVRMAFGGVEVVKGVDLELRASEVHAIVGENGAGKSTLAKLIAGVYRPTAGSLEIDGNPVVLESPRQAIERGIALIHQEPLTFPHLDVAENIFVGHQPISRGGIDWKAMRRRAREILELLGVKLDPQARVGGLSVADQQMVELAAALSHDAKVLLMDETTASLTPKEVAELFTIVRRLRAQGRAIAFVSHHLDEIFEIADRITVMRDGEKVAERLPSETSVEEIVRLMVGRDVAATTSVGRKEFVGSPILRVTNLSVAGKFEPLSFEVRPGEIVGIAGLVGAGRTDVCRALFGVGPRPSGQIEIGGEAVEIRSPRDAMKHGVAMVPEDRQHEGLLLPLSIAENATLPLARKGWRKPQRERALAKEFADRLRTAYRSVDQPVRQLSGGNQQKIVLGKWLMTSPKILILDEPTRGVDVGAKDEVHRLIQNLVADGMAILMVSSDLPELLALSDRVLVMRAGRLVDTFTASEATPERVMFAATGVA